MIIADCAATCSRTSKANSVIMKKPSVHGMIAHATVFSSSGGVNWEPFPPVRGFGILSEMSHPKSYTEIVGGSIGRPRLCTACAAAGHVVGPMLQDRLEAANFSWSIPHIHLQEEIVKRVNTGHINGADCIAFRCSVFRLIYYIYT